MAEKEEVRPHWIAEQRRDHRGHEFGEPDLYCSVCGSEGVYYQTGQPMETLYCPFCGTRLSGDLEVRYIDIDLRPFKDVRAIVMRYLNSEDPENRAWAEKICKERGWEEQG